MIFLFRRNVEKLINDIYNKNDSEDEHSDFIKKNIEKSFHENRLRNKPQDGRNLLDFVISEVYFHKKAIIKSY